MKIPRFVSSNDKERLASEVIKSERQTKEQRVQRKYLEKNKNKACIPKRKQNNHTFNAIIIISQ